MFVLLNFTQLRVPQNLKDSKVLFVESFYSCFCAISLSSIDFLGCFVARTLKARC